MFGVKGGVRFPFVEAAWWSIGLDPDRHMSSAIGPLTGDRHNPMSHVA